jgi:hypothetical protein
MHLLIIALACLGLWLLFPKGFAHTVGAFVGMCAAGFAWGLGFIIMNLLHLDPSWTTLGWTFVGLQVVAVVVSFVVVSRS